ncbi:MAG: hypothetical protein OIN84_21525, partial [Candidatus Methanoperedens sp.]|nr:hypothetical protein [Candidatus Methanoperedens sp.]
MAFLNRTLLDLAFLRRSLTVYSSGTSTQNGSQDEEETQPVPLSQRAISKDRVVEILVVEDEGIVALDIKMTLRRMGHHVIATVDSGNDAIRLVT